MKSAFFLFAFAFALAASAAEPVFKSIMPDGKVIYSEKPQPGAAKVEKIDPPPPRTGVGGLTQTEISRAEQQARDRALAEKKAEVAKTSVAEARKQLTQAEAALAAGKEPRENERIGIAGGGSRLNDAYFARLKGLEEAVALARKRVADAESGK